MLSRLKAVFGVKFDPILYETLNGSHINDAPTT